MSHVNLDIELVRKTVDVVVSKRKVINIRTKPAKLVIISANLTGFPGPPGPMGVEGPPGPEGPQGLRGADGAAGMSLMFKGRVPASSELPPDSYLGDAYVTADTNEFWVWSEIKTDLVYDWNTSHADTNPGTGYIAEDINADDDVFLTLAFSIYDRNNRNKSDLFTPSVQAVEITDGVLRYRYNFPHDGFFNQGLWYSVITDVPISRIAKFKGDEKVTVSLIIPGWVSGGSIVGPPGIVWKSNWDPRNNYVIGDAVYYNGSSFIATVDISAFPEATTPKRPGEDSRWDILVKGA